MTRKHAAISGDSRSLRRRAEAMLRTDGDDPVLLATEDMRSLLYELATHQIELELQNEELRRAQEELVDARDRYSTLYDRAPVGYLTLDDDVLSRDVTDHRARLQWDVSF